jgi:secreted trypsin-like serine protease
MHRILARLALIAIVSLACVGALARAAELPGPSIVGGSDAPDPNPYVYQVSIGTAPHTGKDSHYCGGSLIAASWVLSAAHCFVDSASGAVTAAADIGVLIDTRVLSAAVPAAQRTVARLIVHPDYSRTTFLNDIALLELGAPAPTSLLVPLADAASEAARAAPGATATATGWGGLLGYPGGQDGPNGGQTYPDTLQVVQLPIVDSATCSVASGQLCAGPAEGGKDTCQGDSGGPLVVGDGQGGYLLVGVVSNGAGCAQPNVYGTYTRVSAYRDWITTATAAGGDNRTPQLYLPMVES